MDWDRHKQRPGSLDRNPADTNAAGVALGLPVRNTNACDADADPDTNCDAGPDGYAATDGNTVTDGNTAPDGNADTGTYGDTDTGPAYVLKEPKARNPASLSLPAAVLCSG